MVYFGDSNWSRQDYLPLSTSMLSSVSCVLRAANHTSVTLGDRNTEPGCQIRFLLRTTGPRRGLCPFRGSESTLLQCGRQSCRWNCSPIPRLVVKLTGTNLIPRCVQRDLYLSFLVFSATLVPEFTLRNERLHALEWVTVGVAGRVGFYHTHIEG